MFANGQNVYLPLQAWLHRMETCWLSSKEKVLSAAISKEGEVNCDLKHEITITIDFLDKGATVNSNFFLQSLHYFLNGLRRYCYWAY